MAVVVPPRLGPVVLDGAAPSPEPASSARLHRIVLAFVVLVGAALRLYALPRVRLNPFYDAAVRSMGMSWHSFFYGAFDPAGQVSIDKTPADLWLQVASTKVLGFTPTALRLPEVLAGVLAVPLLYDLVRRLVGPRAGLASAAVLAVLPVSVVTARSDTMDSLMMLLVLAAAWLVERAGRTGRTWPLLGAGAVMGLAFNVKLFEALIALPALVVLAVLVSARPWRRRMLDLAAAGVVLAAVSVSWLVAVSLSPSAGRPYPIGSTNGSVWNVVFVYNGLDRVRTAASPAQARLDPAGVTRLFAETDVHEGRLVGTALLAALLVGTAVLLTLAWERLRHRNAPGDHGDDGGTPRSRRAGAVFLGVWLVVGFVLFSRMGRLHPRYLEAFTPAVAGTTGAGIAWLAGRARGRGEHGRVAGSLLVLATALTVMLAPHVATQVPVVAVAIAVAAVVATAALAIHASRIARPWATGALTAAALVAVLTVPTSSAMRLSAAGTSSSGRPGAAPAELVASLSRFLLARQGTARYEVASSAVAKTGPLIVRDGRPVLMLTSLYDRPLLTPAQLAAKVRAGEVRYVLLGRAACSSRARRCAPVVRWARRHGTDVSRAAGQRPGMLYALKAGGAG